jgi:arylsulfatase
MLSGGILTTLVANVSAREVAHETEQCVMQKILGEEWLASDKKVRVKLAALEANYRKKPNIISVLVDDVGYSELGVYGGGKLRGAPTPNLHGAGPHDPNPKIHSL